MDLREEYLEHMKKLKPMAEDLPGELPMISNVIEESAPGMGVKITMHLATAYRGIKVYWHSLDGSILLQDYARGKWPVSPDELKETNLHHLPSNDLRMIASSISEVAAGMGIQITLRLAWAFRGMVTHWHNIDRITEAHRNYWLMKRYDLGDVTGRELAMAVGISQRRSEDILSGNIGGTHIDSRQIRLFD